MSKPTDEATTKVKMKGDNSYKFVDYYLDTPADEFNVSSDLGAETPALAGLIAALESEETDTTASGSGWKMDNVSFYCNGAVGKLICDTGAFRTAVASSFAKAAGLNIRQLDGAAMPRSVSGSPLAVVGVTDVPLTIQLLMELDHDAGPVYWNRHVTLKEVLVLDLGEDPPRHIYVSWKDFNYEDEDPDKRTPLGDIYLLVRAGAKLMDARRVPSHPIKDNVDRVILTRGPDPAEYVFAITVPKRQPVTDDLLAELRASVGRTLPNKHEPEVARLIELQIQQLLSNGRDRVFGDLCSAECTEIVDFVQLKTPKEVTFQTRATRKAPASVVQSKLDEWEALGVVERVPYSTPAYGFAVVVPKPGGKFRLAVNPCGINDATERDDPEGGYMPANMLMAALSTGRKKYATKLDCKDAFLTMKLGPVAQKLSVHTTCVGKYRWLHGYFGWHSFPAKYQRIIMQKVVLPIQQKYGDAVAVLAWIDDLVVAADTLEDLVTMTTDVVDAILSFGGRLSLHKCEFMVQQFDWCGVEVNLERNEWRVARGRVESLRTMASPTDRTTLQHTLGILRYYYHGVQDHKAQRDRLAKLSALDKTGMRIKEAWTAEHETALREAIDEILNGKWLMVYDPKRPVFVTTDASGNNGYCITAHQYDDEGKMQPICYMSYGWLGGSTKWSAQVKECYAQRQAVCKVMEEYFPKSQKVILLCDNKNLSFKRKSVDPRVRRWQEDIAQSGCVERFWVPGEWNTIADHGSRVAIADPTKAPDADMASEMYIYGVHKGPSARRGDVGITSDADVPVVPPTESAAEGTPADQERQLPRWFEDTTGERTAVPGHASKATEFVWSIAEDQLEAPMSERKTWKGSHYSTVRMGNHSLVLYKGRLLVPDGAKEVKAELLELIHDHRLHVPGIDRALMILRNQCKVYWRNMDSDVAEYIGSCTQCQMSKAHRFGESMHGDLMPTVAPTIHHTWYADLKGPMPKSSGYLLAVVESCTRFLKLRFVPKCTTDEVIEELYEVFHEFGTWPRVLRTDNGPPFHSKEFEAFCVENHIMHVKGVPHHSQGQGMVETRFRPIANALMATLGAKAAMWWMSRRPNYLSRLQFAINSTPCIPLDMSPFEALTGRKAHTSRSAKFDWTSADFGQYVLGDPAVTYENVQAIIAAHHENMHAVQSGAALATTVAQAITKIEYDAARSRYKPVVGDWVLLL